MELQAIVVPFLSSENRANTCKYPKMLRKSTIILRLSTGICTKIVQSNIYWTACNINVTETGRNRTFVKIFFPPNTPLIHEDHIIITLVIS